MNLIIVMATYNGEKYIREQLNSLFAQTMNQWQLFIRDDGSTDGTISIIEQYQKKYPHKIRLFQKNDKYTGAKYNFWELCKQAYLKQAEYVMLCDQDDVWNKNKIEITFKTMLKAERKYGKVPILVHTDLMVTDDNLHIIGDSFIKYRALNPDYKTMEKILVQNNATGCTMMLNHQLLTKAMKAKNIDNVALHDWWFTVIASLFGKIVFVPKQTIKYRQHPKNVVGATKVNTISFIIKRLTGSAHVRETFILAEKQAAELLSVYGNDLPPHEREVIRKFAAFPEKNKFVRLFEIFKYGLLKQGIIQIIGEIIFV